MVAAFQAQSPHQPFPIADFRTGFFDAKESWLSPSAAWRELKNGRTYRGRLEKRRGFSRLSEMGVEASTVNGTQPSGGVADNWNAFYGTFTITDDGRIDGMIPETATFSWTDGGSATLEGVIGTIEYPIVPTAAPLDNLGIVVYDASDGTTVIGNYVQGLDGFVVLWNQHTGYTSAGADKGTLDYSEPNEEPCMGIYTFRDNTGTETLLAMDTELVYEYDSTLGVFSVHADSPSFTGNASNYFWAWPFDDYLMFTNGVDPVYKFTPGASPEIEEVDTDFVGSSANDIDTAQIVVRFRGRAVYLNVTENGTQYPRRARWSTAGAFETFADEFGFIDAPTNLGEIRTAQFIGSRLFVGFDQGWMELVDTEDASRPYSWEPTTSRYGSTAKLTTIADSDRLLTRSESGIQALDPNGQYAVDVDIPDYVIDLDPGSSALSAAARNEGYRSFWWTFANVGETTPQHILSAQYDEQNNLSWSVFDMAFNVFGEFENETSRSWDSFSPATWDELTVPWNSARGASGYPRLLGGTSDGTIYIFDDSDTDFGVTIPFRATSQKLAPFPGQSAHLGWVDVYASAAPGVTITLSFIGAESEAVYLTREIDLTPSGAADKVWRRVSVNRRSAFHRIRVESSGDSFFAIDALVPYFRPSGRTQVFG